MNTPETVPPVHPPAAPRPKRRPRYAGKNPRRFEEKYKELNPEKYPETLQKVLAAGKTPAGMHRPIMVEEVLAALQPCPGATGVDATLGYGGHTTELLPRLAPGGRLIALDTDPLELPKTEARLRQAGFGPDTLIIRHTNYAGLPQVLNSLGVAGVDFVLADLGCSSMQLDDPARGFSFKTDGPLDLRMNPQKGRPASALLQRISEPDLITLLQSHADEPHAPLLARAMVQNRASAVYTTGSLTTTLRQALGSLSKSTREQEGDTPIRRVFQALRIAVNDEFSALEAFLRVLPGVLNPGGRAVILTFHSGEDRRVKRAMQEGREAGLYQSIAREVTRPGPEELRANPRAASAKLRWAVRG